MGNCWMIYYSLLGLVSKIYALLQNFTNFTILWPDIREIVNEQEQNLRFSGLFCSRHRLSVICLI